LTFSFLIRDMSHAPLLVLNAKTTRDNGRKAQLGNIAAAKAVADIIRTSLGPRAMLKMMLDPIGGITITNDGNSILRELDLSHPAAKSMIELSRAQEEEVGDGTTSVIILAGEMLSVAEPYIERNVHPTVIISAFKKALDHCLLHMNSITQTVDLNKRADVINVVKSSLGTKFLHRWSNLAAGLALDAVLTVTVPPPPGSPPNTPKDIDTKRYVRIEKIPGGEIEESQLIMGVILNKDVTHAKMRRRIENPRILLLDCPLEYKKGESQTNIEITEGKNFSDLLKLEEEAIFQMCNDIIKHKPDLVITEKGLSDLAQHYLAKNNITALRRTRKPDNNRIARAAGATIVSRTDEIRPEDIGTRCGLFEVKKIGDEYFSFITDCKDAKACTILLRGASKDVLNEVERNLQDAISVARNIVLDPRLVPGGGALEMSLSHSLNQKSKSIEHVEQWPFSAVANALEVIPRTLAQNCGTKTIRVITELRAKHATSPTENWSWGIDGIKGIPADMRVLGVWDPYIVKVQTIITAIESACLLLRVDEVVSGISKKDKSGGGGGGPVAEAGAGEGGED